MGYATMFGEFPRYRRASESKDVFAS